MMLKRRFSSYSMVIFLVSVCHANGGPIETSQVHSAGEPGPEFVHRDVELVSEELVFSPGMNFMEVTAIYTLYNPGERLETSYAFPVHAMVYPEDEWYMGEFLPENNIKGFSIKQNGTELYSECSIYGDDQSVVREYGMMLSLITCSYETELSLQAGDTTVVEVSYSVRATYEDWESTKDFFPGYENRRFTYDLSPAACWGNGRAGSFTFTLDCRELFAMGGNVVETPVGGRWITEKLYRMDAFDFPMDSLPPLLIAWESREAAMGNYLQDHIISPERYTVTVSSSLGEGYGGENLTDGNLQTAWSEGAEGTTGEWILIEFEPGVSVSWVGIIPGYAGSEHLYTANARPREAKVVSSMGNNRSTYDQEIGERSWEELAWGTPFSGYAEVFNRGESFPCEWIRITFTGSIPGAVYQDLCVSELVVAGWNEAE